MKKRISSFILVLSLAGCAAPRLIERPLKILETRPLAEQAYQSILTRNRGVTTLRAAATVRVSRGIFSRGLEQAILIKRPDSLRLDSLNLWGELMYQLIHHRGVLQISRPHEHFYRRSEDVARLLHDELQLDVDVQALIQLLSGGIPLEAQENYFAVVRSGKLILRGLRSQLVLDPGSMLPLSFIGYTLDNTTYEVRFEDYRAVSGIQFPYQMSLRVWEPRFSLRVVFDAVSINADIKDEYFRMGQP